MFFFLIKLQFLRTKFTEKKFHLNFKYKATDVQKRNMK